MKTSSTTEILIVGGGFGGVKLAQDLSRRNDVSLTLLSDRLEFRYYPALYHTAVGGARKQSHIPLEHLLDTTRVKLVEGKAKTLNREQKTVTTEDGQELHFDKVIFSLGTVTNYFGIPGVQENSYGIKSWDEIDRFKEHVHSQLDDDKDTELHYIVIGAGPTGIELAAGLPDYLRKIMHYHGVAGRPFKVQIVEAMPRLLPRSPEKISRAVAKRLEALGIEVLMGQTVEKQTTDTLTVSGQEFKCDTVIWTAGMSNNPFFKDNNFTIGDHGKVTVDQYMQAEPDVYVLGDNAGTPFSGMAQTALYDAGFVAGDVAHRLDGKAPKAYKPKKPISVIPAGDHWAAVEWGKLAFAGWIGWLLREAADLVGFHDVEPWSGAIKQWLTELDREESCPVCKKHIEKQPV